MAKKTKSREKSVCRECGRQTVWVHEGDVQPSCNSCGWVLNNVYDFPSPAHMYDPAREDEEHYTLIVNEDLNGAYVSIIAASGRVLYHTEEETRHIALQKAFTALVMKRLR